MDLTVRVGIKTAGEPMLGEESGLIRLDNMLIGDGFHWQQTIKVWLPGAVEPYIKTSEESSENVNITLINSVPLETYLECVVGSEMNPESPLEFLKAHAVISRSWVLEKILGTRKSCKAAKINGGVRIIGWDDTEGHRAFHVCSDDHCQRYQGIQPIAPKSREAISRTAGEVLLTPTGKIVDARFSKCCGGKTDLFATCWQDESPECLESVEDPWCNLSVLSGQKREELLRAVLKNYDLDTSGYGYRWQTEFAKDDVRNNLLSHFNRDIGEIISLEVLHRGPSDRIDLMRIHGSQGVLDIGKELWIRRLLSDTHLYSSAIEIEDCGKKFLIKGKGWGHGVGLCQIGAAAMALQGHDYREILSFYYPGSEISQCNGLQLPRKL